MAGVDAVRAIPRRDRGRRGVAVGFTLIELLIAMTVVGVLAAIAFPAYRAYLVRGYRADAQQVLLRGAQQAERWFTQRNRYSGLDPAFAFGADSGAGIYTFSVASATASTFTLQAQPVAGRTNAHDGALEITHSGQKRWDRNGDGDFEGANEMHWNR